MRGQAREKEPERKEQGREEEEKEVYLQQWVLERKKELSHVFGAISAFARPVGEDL